MEIELTPKELGQRLAKLRKNKGFSQEELSKAVNVSRTSLAQMELGNRRLDIIELYEIAMILGFSIDQFMSGKFSATLLKPHIEKEDIHVERIANPKFNEKKFKNILLYVLEQCAAKPNVGETVLYKLLYFADFNYYELYEEHLTAVSYRKLPYGPVPQNIDQTIKSMLGNGALQRIKTTYHGYTQIRYLPLVKPDLTKMKASEKVVIDKVLEQMSDWSAAKISEYSHKDIPWIISEEGKEINYELAFYRELPYSVRNYENE